jgi:ABC-type uncharacterized transport system permease subunit
MDALIRLLAVATPAAWTAAAVLYLFVFLREDAAAERWAPRAAWAAAAIHVLALASPGMRGICPMVLPASMVSGLGLAVGAVHLCVESRARDRAIGVFPITIAALVSLASAVVDPLHRPAGALPPASTAIHVTGAILGYAGVLLAALFGTLYLVQRHALKRHRFGLFWERLPSLELLDAFSRRSLVAGVVFLTLTIGFGHLVRRAVQTDESYWDAKIVATNLLWLTALVVVVARRFDRIRPVTSAFASVGLFVLTLANLLVVDLFSRVHRDL